MTPIPSSLMIFVLITALLLSNINNGAVVAFHGIIISSSLSSLMTSSSSSRLQPKLALQRLPSSTTSAIYPLIPLHCNHCHQRRQSFSILHAGIFDGNNNGNESDIQPPPKTIPPDILAEITQAEANTPAARARRQRILLYFALTLLGVTTAFFNAFLSSLRYGDGSPSSDLSYYGFDWVQSNWMTGFLFTNKIGGGLGLLGAGLAGTLAEVEIRSKSESIDKIWEEMQRRQSLREGGGSGGRNNVHSKKKKSSMASSSLTSGGRSSSKRQKKRRLSPLEELSHDETVGSSWGRDESEAAVTTMANSNNQNEKDKDDVYTTLDNDSSSTNSNESSGGIVGAISRFYKQADNMAASQALLLNKELEDRGILEKITDETGLRVVGKQKNTKEEK